MWIPARRKAAMLVTWKCVLTVNGNVTNSTGSISLANGYAGDSLTINGDYTGGGSLRMDTELNDDNSATDQLVLNGNTSGTTSVQFTPAISGQGMDNLFC